MLLFYTLCIIIANAILVASFDTCGLQYYKPALHIGHKRSIGGKESNPHSWPWMVLLNTVTTQGEVPVCGGTLLRVNSAEESDIVLSAAHCSEMQTGCQKIKSFNLPLTVTFGNHHNQMDEKGEQTIPVEKYYIHKDYVYGNQNADLMILKLKRPVKFSKTIYPICLDSSKPDLRSDCFVAGWGKTSDNQQAPDTLHEIHVPVPDDWYCTRPNVWGRWPSNMFNITETICAGYPNGFANVCKGDSGGPLMCRTGNGHWAQYGIASRVSGCRCAVWNKPALYVRISNYYPWIMKTIKEFSDVANHF